MNWHKLTQEAGATNQGFYNVILRLVRCLHIFLRQDTDTAFSASTDNLNILLEPLSYKLCDIASLGDSIAHPSQPSSSFDASSSPLYHYQ